MDDRLDATQAAGGPLPPDLATVLYSRQTVDGILDLIVDVAAVALADVDGASVSLVNRQRTNGYVTSNANSPWVRAVDESQYQARSGPCVEAIRTGALVTTSLPDRRWEDFSEEAVNSGVATVESHPLVVDGDAIGALNLYSRHSRMDGTGSTGFGAELLARQAAHVLANAVSFSTVEAANDNLRQALRSRTTIGQAIGILMARQGFPADEAFTALRQASQRSRRKLVDVAGDIAGAAEQDNVSRRSDDD